MPRPVSGTSRDNIVSTRLSDAEYRAVLATGVTRAVWLRQAVRAALGIAPMGTKLPPLVKPAEEAKAATPPPPTPARRQAVAARKTEPRPPARDTSLPLPAAPHRHRRERTGDNWVGGTNVGSWACADCGATLGILQ